MTDVRPLKEMNYAIAQNIGRPRTALVVGFDVGSTAHTVRRTGARVVAIELEPSAMGGTREDADEAHAAKIDAGDEGDLFATVKGERFDLVVLEDVLDRVQRPEPLLERVRERLTDGGHVVATVLAAGRLKRRDALRAMERAGLEVMRYDLNPNILGHPLALGESAVARDDLHVTHTSSFRLTYELVRPLERLVALRSPDRLAIEHLFVARVPPKRGKLSLTVGMLTLNEQESVEKMIDEIRKYAPDANILLVDSSSDRTPEIAREKGARVVRQLPPRGHGPAMERLMYEAAQESDALIYLDCDFTYPADQIPFIRQLLEDGADVVNASRTAKYPEAMPVPNFIANRVFAASAQLVHGVPTTDVHSGMRGYRASMIRAFSFDGSGDALPLDTLILPARSNYKVIEYPIAYHERVGFSKLAKLRGTVWTFIRIANAVGQGKRVGRGSRYDRRR